MQLACLNHGIVLLKKNNLHAERASASTAADPDLLRAPIYIAISVSTDPRTTLRGGFPRTNLGGWSA